MDRRSFFKKIGAGAAVAVAAPVVAIKVIENAKAKPHELTPEQVLKARKMLLMNG